MFVKQSSHANRILVLQGEFANLLHGLVVSDTARGGFKISGRGAGIPVFSSHPQVPL